jgi:predicted HTH transcriptional regulator
VQERLEKRGLKLPARAEVAADLADLNQRQRALLAYLREHESVSRAEYEQMFGVSVITAKRDLGRLLAKGLVVKVGDSKSTRYKRA